MEIIRATDEHCALLGEMNKQLIEDEGHSNPMGVEELIGRMRQWLNHEYTAYIAMIDVLPLAYSLYRDDEEYFYMRQLFVSRQHRRQRIATQLLDWMYQHIWLSKPVRLDVLIHNTAAINFYRTYGFTDYCLTLTK